MYDAPDGFEVPVYRAPLKPRLTLGAPQDFTRYMIAAAALAFIWRLWMLFPLLLVLQGVAIWGTYYDAKWFPKVKQTIKYKRAYKP